MTKKILCPNCKCDLRKEGFISDENVWMRFGWTWNKKQGWFDSDDGVIKGSDDESMFTCGNCDEDITKFVRDNNLV